MEQNRPEVVDKTRMRPFRQEWARIGLDTQIK